MVVAPVPADPVVEQLTGPGGPFEIVVEEVLGVPMQVYKNRLGTMRDLIALADARADVEFLVHEGRRLTFGEHNARVRRLAASLLEQGVEPGDRVALLSANTIEWVITFWAAAAVGAALVPLNAWWKTEELEYALRDSGARVLVCDAKRRAAIGDLPSRIPSLEAVAVMDGPAPPATSAAGGSGGPDEIAFSDLLAGDTPDALPGVEVAEDDILGILYTSGTTGAPKGATVTHRQAVANLQNIFLIAVAGSMKGAAAPELSGDMQNAALLVVPLFHVTGSLATMVVTYASGGKLVLMPPGRFEPETALRIIQDERITAIGGVPTVMWRIVESPALGSYDLSSVSRCSYGGAPAAPELVERIEGAFPKVRQTLSTAYGLTETASVATINSGDDYFDHPGSVGRAVPTVEIRVTDDGRVLPPGEAGEIEIKGPTVMMRGYWRLPDATAEVLSPDGWFRSGDVGYLDADGFLTIVDRAKDMVIRGGENVYCVEVENALYSHPDVIDAAVIGVPHRTLGEEVKAVVQLRDGARVGPAELREHCARHLADFKVPSEIEVRAEPLPRNPAGKILKNLLRGDESSFAATADDAVL